MFEAPSNQASTYKVRVLHAWGWWQAHTGGRACTYRCTCIGLMDCQRCDSHIVAEAADVLVHLRRRQRVVLRDVGHGVRERVHCGDRPFRIECGTVIQVQLQILQC